MSWFGNGNQPPPMREPLVQVDSETSVPTVVMTVSWILFLSLVALAEVIGPS